MQRETQSRRWWQRVCWALCLSLIFVLPTTAQAQANKKKKSNIDEADTSKSGYVLPYVTLGFCIGMGIVVVCIPHRRTGRADDGGL